MRTLIVLLLVLSGGYGLSARADGDSDLSKACGFHFGQGGEDNIYRPKFQTRATGDPSIELKEKSANPACAKLEKKLTELIKNGQKACVDGMLAGLKMQVDQAKKRGTFRPQGTPACPCVECAMGAQAVHKLVEDGSAFLGAISGGYVSVDPLRAEKQLDRVKMDYYDLLSDPAMKDCGPSGSALDQYSHAAQSELTTLSLRLMGLREHGLKGSYWDRIDANGGGGAMSQKQAVDYVKQAQASSDPIVKRVGDLMAEARDPKSKNRKVAASQLQNVLASFHRDGDLSGTFVVDGLVERRSITDARKMLETNKNELARRLIEQGVSFPAGAVVAKTVPEQAPSAMGPVVDEGPQGASVKTTYERTFEASAALQAKRAQQIRASEDGRIPSDPNDPNSQTIPVTGIFVPSTTPITLESAAIAKTWTRPNRMDTETGFHAMLKNRVILCKERDPFSGAIVHKAYHESILKNAHGGYCP